MKSKGTEPVQLRMLDQDIACADVNNLPLVVKSLPDQVEVLAPGSVYQPLLLSSERTEVTPGKLDANEARFVRDLIGWLYPGGDHPKSPRTPLRWGEREVWFKRNINNARGAFRLRVDDSDWFYPDFIVWILDPAKKEQIFGFVDPKGLIQGLGNGWSDYKLVSTVYMPHVVARHIAEAGETVRWHGEDWSFRIRGVIVSTTGYDDLKSHMSKFEVEGQDGTHVTPAPDAFRRGRIVFRKGEGADYIADVLDLLVTDTPIDDLMAGLARRHGDPDTPPDTPDGRDPVLDRHRQIPTQPAPEIRRIVGDVLRKQLLSA